MKNFNIKFNFKGETGVARKTILGDYEFIYGSIRSLASRCNKELQQAIIKADRAA